MDRALAQLTARLRAAGCVFAEDEAAILLERAGSDAALLEELTMRRIDGEPLETLVGWVDFGGLRLAVGPGAFVPRQRTLALAERAVRELEDLLGSGSGRPVFVEAFCGVAPVATTLAEVFGRDSNATGSTPRIFACDTDPLALGYARKNLGSAGEVCLANVLDGLPEELRGRVDLIAAVPPYVPEDELELLPHEARDHEPLAALIGGTDGMRWIDALVEEAAEWLVPGGVLLVEFAERQERAVRDLSALLGFVPLSGSGAFRRSMRRDEGPRRAAPARSS